MKQVNLTKAVNETGELFAKRGLSYLIMKVIMLFPVIKTWNFLISPLFSNYMEVTGQPTNGFLYLSYDIHALFLPSLFPHSISNIDYRWIRYTFIPTVILLLCFILLETLILLIFKGDISRKLFKYQLCRTNGGKLWVWLVLLRSIVKYLTIAYAFPLLIFPIFNKRRLFLHEIISGVCKAEKYPPQQQ